MRLSKEGARASLVHDLTTAVPQAPEPEIQAAATTALASIPSDASLSLGEVNAVITKAVRDLRAAPISFGTPKTNIVAVETTKATDGDKRRSFRITRAS